MRKKCCALILIVLLLLVGLAGLVLAQSCGAKRKFYDPMEFPRLGAFADSYAEIRSEAIAARQTLPVLDVERARDTWIGNNNAVQEFAQQLDMAGAGWVRAWHLHSNRPNSEWLNLPLMAHGVLFRANAAYCPRLAQLLRERSDIINVAGLSLMTPHSLIPTHTDTTGAEFGSLAYHLGLVVPPNCTLTVDGTVVEQQNGKSLVFDSTYSHSAANHSDEDRIILYIDFKVR
jgi:hypothetical protein